MILQSIVVHHLAYWGGNILAYTYEDILQSLYYHLFKNLSFIASLVLLQRRKRKYREEVFNMLFV